MTTVEDGKGRLTMDLYPDYVAAVRSMLYDVRQWCSYWLDDQLDEPLTWLDVRSLDELIDIPTVDEVEVDERTGVVHTVGDGPVNMTRLLAMTIAEQNGDMRVLGSALDIDYMISELGKVQLEYLKEGGLLV